jgi:hypothetical protein
MRLALSALAASALWLAARPAEATVTIAQVDRDGAGHGDVSVQYEFYVSRADCEAGESFEFPFTLSSVVGIDSLEVWLGEGSVDCATATARSGTGGSQCTKLYADGSPSVNGSVVLTADQIANEVAGIDACSDSNASNTSAHATKLYFLAIRTQGSDVAAADAFVWDRTKVDLLGPEPPADLTVKGVDGGVLVNFTASASTDDLREYQVYCDAEGTSGAGGGTGVGGTGGGGGAGTSGGTGGMLASGGAGGAMGLGGTSGTAGSGGNSALACDPGRLVPGEAPPTNTACGDPFQGAQDVGVSGFENGRTYAVGVAAVDVIGNPGALSPLACATPVASDDFFEVYRRAGGQGGCESTIARGGGSSRLGWSVGLALAAMFVARRRGASRMGRRARAVAVGGCASAAFLCGGAELAHAQSAIPRTDWRQTSRPPQPHPDTQFAFELRFAPYWPEIDSEPGLTGTPFADTFGTDPRFYFGLEFDWLPLRVPYVGAIGPGFGWGYTWASGDARISGCSGSAASCASSDTTSLSIHPMHVSGVVRLDELMRRADFPLVPYAKGGLGFGYWTSSSTAGMSQVVEANRTIDAEGVSVGLHLAFGAAFSLSWLDASSQSTLREDTGLGNLYLFGEWMRSSLGSTGDAAMRVGTSTVVTGLSADF